MDNPETQATLDAKHRRGNQEWTIQRHSQYWALDTEGQSRMDNPETQATLGTRHRREIKNGQSRDTGNIGH